MVTSFKIVINFVRAFKNYTVYKNCIGSAVRKILRYTQTYTETNRHPNTFIKRFCGFDYMGKGMNTHQFKLPHYEIRDLKG